MADYKYFTEDEFNKLTPSCSLSDMDEEFMKRLDKARAICDFPFIVTSAYRSHSWNVEHGRDYHSFHEDGKAVDIHCMDGKRRAWIVASCWLVGIRGIGIYSSFLHLDARSEPCLFIGKK